MTLNQFSNQHLIGESNIENHQLSKLIRSNQTTNKPYPPYQTIIDFIEDQVQLIPDKVALIYKDKALTYREMDQLANQLANYLKSWVNIKPDDRIGLMLDRSERLIIALLAIMKTGAAYVPISPTHPEDSLHGINQESQLSLLLTEKAFEEIATKVCKRTLIWEEVSWKTSSIKKPMRELKPHHLMYVMFSSCVNEKLKVVAVEHINVVHALNYFLEEIIPKSAENILAMSTSAFDLSILEAFSMFMKGNTLVMASHEDQFNPEALIDLITKHNITVVQTTSTTWSMLADTVNWSKFPPISIICGGEYLSSTS